MTNVGYHIRNEWQQKPPLGVQLDHAHPLAKGLVGCWLFNEGGGDKAYDLSGYNNHGTLENMAFPATTVSGWNPGKDGPTVMFDDGNDYVDCGNNASLNITGSLSIELLLKLNSITGSAFIIERGRNGVGGYEMFRSVSQITLRINNPGGRYVVWTPTLAEDTWYHIVAIYTVGQVGNVWVNGVRSAGLSPGSAPVSIAEPLYLGRMWDGDYPFGGAMGIVRVYNRALSAQEAQQLYIAPYAMFEPATKYTIIDEQLSTPHVGSNIAAMQMLR